MTWIVDCDNITMLEMNIAFPSRSIRFSPHSNCSYGSENINELNYVDLVADIYIRHFFYSTKTIMKSKTKKPGGVVLSRKQKSMKTSEIEK